MSSTLVSKASTAPRVLCSKADVVLVVAGFAGAVCNKKTQFYYKVSPTQHAWLCSDGLRQMHRATGYTLGSMLHKPCCELDTGPTDTCQNAPVLTQTVCCARSVSRAPTPRWSLPPPAWTLGRPPTLLPLLRQMPCP